MSDTVRKGFRFPAEFAKRLQELAEYRGVPETHIVIEAVDAYYQQFWENEHRAQEMRKRVKE